MNILIDVAHIKAVHGLLEILEKRFADGYFKEMNKPLGECDLTVAREIGDLCGNVSIARVLLEKALV